MLRESDIVCLSLKNEHFLSLFGYLVGKSCVLFYNWICTLFSSLTLVTHKRQIRHQDACINNSIFLSLFLSFLMSQLFLCNFLPVVTLLVLMHSITANSYIPIRYYIKLPEILIAIILFIAMRGFTGQCRMVYIFQEVPLFTSSTMIWHHLKAP